MAREVFEETTNRNLRSIIHRDKSNESTQSKNSAPKAGPSRRPRSSRPSKPPSPSPSIQEEEDDDDVANISTGRGQETQFVHESDEELWTAECILDERGPPRTGEYLIRWAGLDPETGQPWEPSWEPRGNVTRPLADEWKAKKKADPSVVGVERKKFEEQAKAKRAEQRKAKKRKRDSAGRKSKKRARDSNSRASASTGTGTPALAGAQEDPKDKQEATATTKAPKDSEVPADNPGDEFDGIEDVMDPMDDLPVDDVMAPMDDLPGEDLPSREPDNGAPEAEVDNGVADYPQADDDEDVVEVPVQPARSPAKSTSTPKEKPDAEKKAANGDAPEPSRTSIEPSSLASKEVATEREDGTAEKAVTGSKRVRMDPVTVTIETSAAGKAKATTPEKAPRTQDKAAVEKSNDADEETDAPVEEANATVEKPDAPVEEANATVEKPDAPVEKPNAPVDETDEGPSQLATEQNDIAKTSEMTPITIPDAERFRSFLPSGQSSTVDSSQSTTSIGPSQVDSITQFSSPARESLEKAKKQKNARIKADNRDKTAAADSAPRQEIVPPLPAKTTDKVDTPNTKATPNVVTRYINGEEVMAIESDSDDETEDADNAEAQAPTQEQSQSAVVDEVMEVENQVLPDEVMELDHQDVPADEASQPDQVESSGETSSGDEGETGPPSPDVIIHTTQTATLETVTELELPEPASSAVEPNTTEAEPDKSSDQAAVESDALKKQAEEIEDLKRLLQARDAEIGRLVIKSAALEVASAPVSNQGSRATSPQVSPHRNQALATVREVLLAERPNSPLRSQISDIEVANTASAVMDESPNGQSAYEAGPSTSRRTANSSTPPTHMTSDQADLALRLAKKDALISSLKQKVQKAEKDHESTRERLAFMQDHYQNASDSAVREVSRANEAEEQVRRLRGQLKLGLKQRELITAAVKAEHAKEIDKIQSQLKLLLDQSRATDDVVRSRAAAYKDLKSEVVRLQSEVRQGMDKNQSLSARNDKLLGEIELFRAREMGVIGPVDDSSDDSSYMTESDYESAASPPPVPKRNLRATASQSQVQAQAPASQAPTPAAAQTSVPAPALTPVTPAAVEAVVEPRIESTEIRNGQAFQSPWTPGLFFTDEGAVKDHMMKEIDGLFV